MGAKCRTRTGLCVRAGGLRNGGGLFLQSFHSSKASSTLPPRPATPHQLFVDRRPFHALVVVAAAVNPRCPSRALLLLPLPSGEAGRCTLLGLILRPEVELDLGAGGWTPPPQTLAPSDALLLGKWYLAADGDCWLQDCG